MTGFITKGVGGSYTVLTNGYNMNEHYYTCTARGVFRNRNTTPLVGDNVEIAISDPIKKIASIQKILPRKNQLRRPPAANISQVIITAATTQPDFNPGLLDRFLLLVEYEEIPILICVNKIDLSPHTEFEPYLDAGYDMVFTNATGTEGLDELRKKMAGEINLFAGPSGVGKSSLINALMPGIDLETGDLSAKLGRGKHTTRHTEIFPLGNLPSDGFCFDTPGFTSIDIEHIQKNELAYLFREFRPFINACKFNNCSHIKEIDCAVKEQIGSAIHPARYESYVSLFSR
ncbi:MAG: ribosome small subunit-dependent GTPase A [Defluviitaleaceae bacterium]|nr:ribosome small subunit-dependent GTPase A [Defluviitaleaceae bacterium]